MAETNRKSGIDGVGVAKVKIRRKKGEGTRPRLLPRHLQMLREESGISEEVIHQRGYCSIRNKRALRRLGFRSHQCRVPGILIPLHGVDGKKVGYQFRPDDPREGKGGKPVKYETPQGSRLMLDVPPSVQPLLADPAAPLYGTEGSRKADAASSNGLCCISIAGVFGWRGRNEAGGLTALPDWENVALNGRQVYLVFDSDSLENPNVAQALLRLEAFLRRRGANVGVVRLEPGPDGEKTGLDDYFARGGSADALPDLVMENLRPLQELVSGSPEAAYEQTEEGIFHNRMTQHGPVRTWLTNFPAQITTETIRDDAAMVRRITAQVLDNANGPAAR